MDWNLLSKETLERTQLELEAYAYDLAKDIIKGVLRHDDHGWLTLIVRLEAIRKALADK
jgi:hypothetical protein